MRGGSSNDKMAGIENCPVVSHCIFFFFSQRADVNLGERASFLVNTVYKDEDTFTLIKAATEVLGMITSTSLHSLFSHLLL